MKRILTGIIRNFTKMESPKNTHIIGLLQLCSTDNIEKNFNDIENLVFYSHILKKDNKMCRKESRIYIFA